MFLIIIFEIKTYFVIRIFRGKIMKQKKPLILIILLSAILLVEIMYYLQKNDVIEIISHKITNEDEIKDELILSFFMNNIESESSVFYDNYFPEHLAYYDYDTKILDLKRGSELNRRYIYITFGSTPMIGAHNPVGYDEISYKVDVQGNITLENFIHLKSFEIPEHLRTNMIKTYPEIQ
jgi:hypothetical protein